MCSPLAVCYTLCESEALQGCILSVNQLDLLADVTSVCLHSLKFFLLGDFDL